MTGRNPDGTEEGFLTNHARVLLCIAHDPGARLRDLAAGLGITERNACAIVADLAQAGYVIKQKDGRRNRYQIEAHLPLPEPGTREPAISEVLGLLLGNTGDRDGPPGLAAAARPGGMDGAVITTTRPGAGPGAWLVTKLNRKTDKCRTILAIYCLFSGTSVASITERRDRLSPTARSARGSAEGPGHE